MAYTTRSGTCHSCSINWGSLWSIRVDSPCSCSHHRFHSVWELFLWFFRKYIDELFEAISTVGPRELPAFFCPGHNMSPNLFAFLDLTALLNAFFLILLCFSISSVQLWYCPCTIGRGRLAHGSFRIWFVFVYSVLNCEKHFAAYMAPVSFESSRSYSSFASDIFFSFFSKLQGRPVR